MKSMAKLTELVQDKARKIAREIDAPNEIEFRFLRDRALGEYFGNLGFKRVWDSEAAPKNRLLVLVKTNYLMSVDKNTADKILVLGLP